MKDRLYKDAEISETINIITTILLDNKMVVTEELNEGFDGVYSVRVIIAGLNLGTNGKGLTQETALASAYGELMERIQNFALYKFNFPTKDRIYDSDFYYAPDEKKISFDEYNKYLEVFKEAIDGKNVSIENLITLNKGFEIKNKVVMCVPYIKYGCEDPVLVPAQLTKHVYGSTGMAAGNTYSEALVQSISEIFERYSNKVISEGEIIPPDIPLEDIEISPKVLDVISKLKKKGNYNIIFKDCSLGIGLPVVGMYFIDKDTGKYFIKFGAHPILSIAVERTITELFQGRKFLYSNLWLKHFSFSEYINKERNFEKILTNGDGVYPYIVFSKNQSYSYSYSWYKGERTDNDTLFKFLYKIIKNNDWSLYHRDVSFLGFPALHAFVPEISYKCKISKEFLDRHYQYKMIKEYMKCIDQCSTNELASIISFIDMSNYAVFDTISPLIGLPLSGDGFFGETNNLYFKYLLNYRIGDYEKALKSLDSFIKNNNLLNSKSGTFYRCLREATYALHIEKVELKEVKVILNNMYDSNIVKRVLYRICDNGLFDEFQDLPCYECENCSYNEKCLYPQVVKFDNAMSLKYAQWKEKHNG